jgi:WD40 repeat protein
VIRLWESDGTLRLVLEQHAGPVNALAFSTDGKRLVSAGDERLKKELVHSILVWDARSGDFLRRMIGHTSEVRSVAIHGKRVASAGGLDRTVRLWDLDTGKSLHVYGPLPQLVPMVALRPDGKRLAASCWDDTVRIWELDPTTAKFPSDPVQWLRGDFDRIEGLALAAGAARLTTVTRDGIVRLWDTERRQDAIVYDLPAMAAGMGVSLDRPLVVVAGTDGNMHLWNWHTGEKQVIANQGAEVAAVALAGDGTVIAAGSDGKLRRCSLASGRLVGVFDGPTALTAMAMHPSGEMLVTGTRAGIVQFWDLSAGRVAYEAAGHLGAVSDLAFSPDGRRLASAGPSGGVILCDSANGAELHRIDEAGFSPASVSFSAEGRWLAIGDRRGSIRLWNLAAGRTAQVLTGHASEVADVTFSHSGRRLASASHDGTIKLWDLATGLELLTLHGGGREMSAVAFAHDDDALVSLGRTPEIKAQVRVWLRGRGE